MKRTILITAMLFTTQILVAAEAFADSAGVFTNGGLTSQPTNSYLATLDTSRSLNSSRIMLVRRIRETLVDKNLEPVAYLVDGENGPEVVQSNTLTAGNSKVVEPSALRALIVSQSPEIKVETTKYGWLKAYKETRNGDVGNMPDKTSIKQFTEFVRALEAHPGYASTQFAQIDAPELLNMANHAAYPQDLAELKDILQNPRGSEALNAPVESLDAKDLGREAAKAGAKR